MLCPPHDVSGSEPSLRSVLHLDCSVSIGFAPAKPKVMRWASENLA
jgi:hypothetical protein